MSATDTAQGFSASVAVENEEPITLGPELTEQIRVMALEECENDLRDAMAEIEVTGITTQDAALKLARAAKSASRHAEVVYTLTLGPETDERSTT
jgi:hypothetical protein